MVKILQGSCWGAVLGSVGPLCSDQLQRTRRKCVSAEIQNKVEQISTDVTLTEVRRSLTTGPMTQL